MRVTVSSSDGLTPVNGATMKWTATNGASLSACNGQTTCSVFTDESGQVETRVTIGAVGTTTITAALAPASYTPSKTVQLSIGGTSSAKDLPLLSPKIWVIQDATLDIPLAARLLSNGVPPERTEFELEYRNRLRKLESSELGDGWCWLRSFHAARESPRRRCARHSLRRVLEMLLARPFMSYRSCRLPSSWNVYRAATRQSALGKPLSRSRSASPTPPGRRIR